MMFVFNAKRHLWKNSTLNYPQQILWLHACISVSLFSTILLLMLYHNIITLPLSEETVCKKTHRQAWTCHGHTSGAFWTISQMPKCVLPLLVKWFIMLAIPETFAQVPPLHQVTWNSAESSCRVPGGRSDSTDHIPHLVAVHDMTKLQPTVRSLLDNHGTECLSLLKIKGDCKRNKLTCNILFIYLKLFADNIFKKILYNVCL